MTIFVYEITKTVILIIRCQYWPFRSHGKHTTYATSKCHKPKGHKEAWKIIKKHLVTTDIDQISTPSLVPQKANR